MSRTLAALRAVADGPSADPTVRRPDGGGDPPAGVVEHILGAPAVRMDRLDQVRRRLAAGDQPSDDDLAERMVARLVCDRLR